MANALVIRRGTQLEKAQKDHRAAQYVRMSTEFQRYSIQNQAAVIAAYAQQRNLSIVRTYVDEGRSGLRIKGRPGLVELINDVESGKADFGHILVYDVSRWGRFQDTDESGHYEFLCKKSGIKVTYCAEQFDNDGTLMSSILKNIKRVMAAEFSRELSMKVHAGQLRLAALGFRVGGPVGYGLRRELVDAERTSKGCLKRGQQKNLKTDRVVLRQGSSEEVKVIRRIFVEYVEKRRSEESIVRELNREGIPNHLGRPWTRRMVDYVLRNENYIGNIVYNRESRPLGERVIKNPADLWVRNEGALPAAIEENVFIRAQARLKLRWQHLTNDEMLQGLRLLLKKKGHLNERIINETLGLPAINVYAERFGSLRNAYRLIGYEKKWDFDWIDRRSEFKAILHSSATEIIDHASKAGKVATFEPGTDVVMVDRSLPISLRLARAWHAPPRNVIWTVYRRVVLPKGHVIAIRLDERNRTVLDYILLPTSQITATKLTFTEVGLRRFDGRRSTDLTQLAKIAVKTPANNIEAALGQNIGAVPKTL